MKKSGGIQPVPVHNVGAFGINLDIPAHLLPPEAWSAGNNMRFRDNKVVKSKGELQLFGDLSIAPCFLLNVPSASQSYWIYTSKTKAYVYEGGVHTNITRQTASVDVNYTAAEERDWNGGILGGIPILNNGADVPQYWSAISPGTKLSALPNWPSTLRAKVVRPFGKFLVALNVTDNGTSKPHMFWWSHSASPGAVPSSWDYTDPSKDAGRKELTDSEGGAIRDALMLQDNLVIYKETSTHIARFIGGNEIIGNNLLLSTSGILAARCVTAFDNGTKHFVATENDFITHAGQAGSVESVFDKRVRQSIIAEIDQANYANAFVFENPLVDEVWFCYPTDGNIRPNKAVIWNYTYNTIQYRDFAGMFAAKGPVQEVSTETWSGAVGSWESDTEPWGRESRSKVLIANPVVSKIFQLDTGELFGTTEFNAYVERTGLAIVGRDRQGNWKEDFGSMKLITRVWPKISGTAVVTVSLGKQDSRDDVVEWVASGDFDPATDTYIDLVSSGRLTAIRFEAEGSEPWQLEGYDLRMTVLGEF